MTKKSTALTEGRQEPEQVRSMFNAIAPTYDRLNHLLSFGLDIGWRRKAISLLDAKHGGNILDIATGSGDLAIDALRIQPSQVVASDFAEEMLKQFSRKIRQKGMGEAPIRLLACDAMHLPFQAGSFDGAMIAFGIRNFIDRLAGLKEMHRVLRPGGISLILELTVPRNPVISVVYKIYTKGFLPLLGKIISRHNAAYTYLPASITKFPEAGQFIGLMRSAGFRKCAAYQLSFGVATIFTGEKE